LLRAPALHFAAAGALVFAATRLFEPPVPAEPATPASFRRIVVDAARIRGLQRDWKLANRSSATESDTRAVVEDLIDDEILFREALAMGFDKADRAIAWRLVQQMRYLGEDHNDEPTTLYHRALAMGLQKSDPVVRRIVIEKIRLIIGHTGPKPTEEELRAWYEAHPADYAQAARVSFRHVYFNRTRRGADDAREAAAQAAATTAGHDVSIAASLHGDPFLLGGELAAQGPDDLLKVFGPKFAAEVVMLPEGRWSAPVESTFGWHVVWIEKRFDARVPPLEDVRSRVEKSVEANKHDQRVAEYLARVRPAYTIEVDESAMGAPGDG